MSYREGVLERNQLLGGQAPERLSNLLVNMAAQMLKNLVRKNEDDFGSASLE